MRWEKIATPCRNFCFLGNSLVTDPVDGSELLALCSYAYPENGALVLINTVSLKMEKYPLPADDASWTVQQLKDGSLLLGTCTHYGAILRFDLAKREWYPVLKSSEEYLLTVSEAPDGFFYCGTYPRAKLYRYDAVAHSLTELGRCSDINDNLYSRAQFTQIPGFVYINCGQAARHVARYDIKTGTMDKHFMDGAQILGIYDGFLVIAHDGDTFSLADGDGRTVIQPSGEESFKTKPHPAVAAHYMPEPSDPRVEGLKGGVRLFPLKNGGALGLRGQELFKLDAGAKQPELVPFTVEPPETMILEMISDGEKLWGASNFGMTVFSYSPETDEAWNSTTICYDFGGEVYGMAAAGRKIYMASYAGGGHHVYDPAQPWNAWDGVNPVLAFCSAPGYIRPIARSRADNNGYIWTGWQSAYGTREMALSRWDTRNDDVTLFEKIAPNKSVYSIASDGANVWFTTYGGANGLPEDKELDVDLYAVDASGNTIFHKGMDSAARPGSIAFAGVYGAVSIGNELYAIDGQNRTVSAIPGVKLKNTRVFTAAYDEKYIAVFDGDSVLIIDPKNKTLADTAPPLPNCETATAHRGGFYAAVGRDIYKLI